MSFRVGIFSFLCIAALALAGCPNDDKDDNKNGKEPTTPGGNEDDNKNGKEPTTPGG